MHILHVYKTYLANPFGGIAQAIAQITKTQNLLHFKHTVLSLSSQRGLHTCNSKTGDISYKQSLSIASNSISLSLLCDFPKIIKQVDIIHYHFPWPFADILHLFWKIKKPTVLTYHSDIIRQKKLLHLYRPFMHSFLNKIDTIVATSPNYLATSPILQQYRDKVVVIPIGLHRENYPKSSKERHTYWQKRFGNRFFLFIGAIRYYKGLHVLLEAAHQTIFPVVIVGSGPMEIELKKQANKLKLTNVHFLGSLPDEDKIALLELCLAVIFPSHLRSEAFGISLLEGAMFGKPLISCEIGTGTSYINVANETGLVVPPQDPLALRQAMGYIWDHPDIGFTMGQQAAVRYWELFTGEKMVKEYEAVYRNLIKNRNYANLPQEIL